MKVNIYLPQHYVFEAQRCVYLLLRYVLVCACAALWIHTGGASRSCHFGRSALLKLLPLLPSLSPRRYQPGSVASICALSISASSFSASAFFARTVPA